VPVAVVKAGHIRELGLVSFPPAAIRAELMQTTTTRGIYGAGNATISQPLSRRPVGENQECSGLKVIVPVISLGVLGDLLFNHPKETPLKTIQHVLVLVNLLQVRTIEARFIFDNV
jgi:hypothetical protein